MVHNIMIAAYSLCASALIKSAAFSIFKMGLEMREAKMCLKKCGSHTRLATDLKYL